LKRFALRRIRETRTANRTARFRFFTCQTACRPDERQSEIQRLHRRISLKAAYGLQNTGGLASHGGRAATAARLRRTAPRPTASPCPAPHPRSCCCSPILRSVYLRRLPAGLDEWRQRILRQRPPECPLGRRR